MPSTHLGHYSIVCRSIILYNHQSWDTQILYTLVSRYLHAELTTYSIRQLRGAEVISPQTFSVLSKLLRLYCPQFPKRYKQDESIKTSLRLLVLDSQALSVHRTWQTSNIASYFAIYHLTSITIAGDTSSIAKIPCYIKHRTWQTQFSGIAYDEH